MKIYKDLYWSIISPQTLFDAWEVFKSDKKNKPDVMKFELDLEQNIFDLYRDLKNGTYKHGPYRGFWIHDPKLRRIHKATVRDRVLHHAIFKVLISVFEPTYIPASFSCRIGKGTHRGVLYVRDTIRKVSKNYTQPCYALKCDVQKFFDSVDQDILIEILKKRIKDPQTMRILEEVVTSYVRGTCERERERERESSSGASRRKGIPIGNLTSQLFANVYMDVFDQFVKHELKEEYYARYTDDFVIISDNADHLKSLVPKIEQCLWDKLRLNLHPKKVSIRKSSRGIDFLGYIILPHRIAVRTKTKKRMVRKLKWAVKQYRNGKVTEENLSASLQSYLGVLSHADAHDFSEDLKNQFLFWKSQ